MRGLLSALLLLAPLGMTAQAAESTPIDAQAMQLLDLVVTFCPSEYAEAKSSAGNLGGATLTSTSDLEDDGYRSKDVYTINFVNGGLPPIFAPITIVSTLIVEKSNFLPTGLFDHPGFSSVTCSVKVAD